MANMSWIGQSLNNRYRIEALLGQGGMSSVYKANDPNLRRIVAVKMIHPHLSNDPAFMRRFEEEAAIVAQLRHDNIVNVFDFNHDNGVYYMVLEYLPGETLEARLKRLNAEKKQMEPADAVAYIAQICDAVGYAHSKGMIHRDIKPDNIMLDIYGRAILMDFGISRMVGGQMHTAAGAVIGTAMYMSPEQIRGEVVDERTDIYSLGVTLFEALTGKPPFEADTAMTLMMKHLNEPVPDVRQLQPGVPDILVRVIKKAMAKDRKDRYASAAEMGAELRSVFTRITGETLRPLANGGADKMATMVESRPLESTSVGAAAQAIPHAAGESKVKTPVLEAVPVTSTREAEAVLNKAAPRSGRSLRGLFLIGGFAILLVIGLVSALLFSRFGNSARSGLIGPKGETATVPVITPTLMATSTTAGAILAAPTSTGSVSAPAVPLSTPTPTIPGDRPYIQITGITIENDRYVVAYKVYQYTEDLSGTHEHFFFNTVPPDQAGPPYKGRWVLFAGPGPFRGFTVANRPAGATQMCALVANANHTLQPDSGNCVDLPNP